MAQALLMPKATAVWLVDNTGLSFDQIAEFCTIHPLEVKAIADGDSAQGIKGLDPISTGQLTREEIEKAQEDPNRKLTMSKPKVLVPERSKKAPRYTPVSRRQDRPNAILWLTRNHAELKDSQIIKLVGTTKPTIQAIKDRTHWNSANLTPSDPVILGLCTQIALDAEVTKAEKYLPPKPELPAGETLIPVAETAPIYPQDAPQPDLSHDSVFGAPAQPPQPREEDVEPHYDVDSVFGKLAELKGDEGGDA
ncbi:MAG: cell cycle transcriptional regulator TrcR [Hyphomicrobiales bacterium]